jgi:prepilin-type processing-associated H-X9-DG protein
MSVRQINRTFYAPTCPYGPYPFQQGDRDSMCASFHFWSQHSGGANFLFADGSVRFLTYTSDTLLPALATFAGHETAFLP